jgi:hypothetical protein
MNDGAYFVLLFPSLVITITDRSASFKFQRLFFFFTSFSTTPSQSQTKPPPPQPPSLSSSPLQNLAYTLHPLLLFLLFHASRSFNIPFSGSPL